MSPSPRAPLKMALRVGLWAAAALLLVLVAALAFLASPLARDMVERRLDGLALGAYGALEVEALSGSLLGELRVRRIAVRDEEGVWLELQDAALHWRPLSLFSRTLAVERVAAETIALARLPPAPPQEDTGGGLSLGGWRLELERLSLPDIALGEGVFGEAARFSLSGEGRLTARAAAARIELLRTDSVGDAFRFEGRLEDAAASARISLIAESGGALSALLGMPGSGVTADGEAAFAAGSGRGTLTAAIDGAPVLEATAAMDDVVWSAEAVLRLGDIPPLAALADRLGEELRVAAELGPPRSGRRVGAVFLDAANLSAEASGGFHPDAFRPRDALAVRVAAPAIGRLIGEEWSDTVGPGRLEGALRIGRIVDFEGEIALEDIALDAVSIASASGPISLTHDDGALDLAATISALVSDTGSPLARALGERPELSVAAGYVIESGDIALDRAALRGAFGEAAGAGRLTGDGAVSLRVDLALTALATMMEGAAGTAQATLSADRAGLGRPLVVSATGGAAGLSLAQAELDALLGPEPAFTVSAQLHGGAIALAEVTAEGAGFIGTAEGVLGPDEDDLATFDLAIAPGGLGGAIALDGALALRGEARGVLGSPALRLEAAADRIAAGDAGLASPSVRMALAETEGAFAGPLRFDAEFEGETVFLEGRLAVAPDALSFEAIRGQALGVSASGALSLGSDTLARGDLRLAAPQENAEARLTLGAADGGQVVEAVVTLGERRLSENALLSAATLRLFGDLEALSVRLEAEATLPQPASLAAAGAIRRSENGEIVATLSPLADIGELALSAEDPWRLTFAPDGLTGSASLTTSLGGALRIEFARAEATRFEAQLAQAPLRALSAMGFSGPMDGLADGAIALSGVDRLEGEAELALSGVTAAESQAEPASASVLMRLGDALDAETRAQTGGFEMRGTLSAPVSLAAWPPAIRINDAGALSGVLDIQGALGEAVALLAFGDIEAAGQVTLQAALSGTMASPAVTGSGQLSDGAVRDAATGLALRDIDAAAAFDGGRLSLDRLSATDPDGGALSVTGGYDIAAGAGALELVLDRLLLVDRADARAIGSGEVRIGLVEAGVEVSGELRIDEADLAPPELGPPGVVVLEIVPVNRPDDLAPPPPVGPPLDLSLDLAVRADRRVFFRASGLETEWAVDARATGSAADPSVVGEVRLIRGALEALGERFVFDEARIELVGPLDETRIDLTARRERADLTAIIRISGAASDPAITWESQPAYPQDEILSRLLFGRSVSELSALEAAQLANALAGLAGGGGVDILGALRRSLGVDRLGVRSGEETGPVVTGGRYIGDDVYLEVESSAVAGTSAEIQWRLRPQLELASRLGGTSGASVSLRWRRDY